jgi:hypothetical protein
MPAESMLAGKLFCASGGFLESDAHSSIPTLGSYSFSLTGLQLSDGNGDSEPCNPAVDEFNPNPRTPPIVRPVMGEISGCFGPTKQ